MIKDISSYIGRVWLWSLEASLFYRTVLVAFLACVVALAFHTEPAFRYCGLILQLMGLGTVVRGIRETRSLFGQPTLNERFQRWRNRRPTFRQPPAVGIGVAIIGAASSCAEAELWMAMPDDAPIEKQLRALKANLLVVSNRVNKQTEKLQADIRESTQKLQDETSARTQMDTKLETLIRSAQTGGLDMSLVGLVWIIFGLLLTTGSLEAEALMLITLGR